ncbi:MAG: tRNA (adenosine(37)-N6)-threonylcarbamoyltransferase complex transferase subunit TsaD [Patescibacteria group bacterium]
MKILSIETSCDETAISIVEANGDFGNANFKILADNLISQIDIHKEYGGVFPALAKREHSKNLIPILRKTLNDAGFGNPVTKLKIGTLEVPISEQIEKILEREPELLKMFLEYIPSIEIPEIDAIAVTQGPGLEPALWVGINFAKALSLVWNKPVIPVNHMEGHLFSAFINGKKFSTCLPVDIFPIVALLISGGHTELILMKAIGEYEKIGQTKDDAIGEAFDKVARMLNLSYPGGPEISKLAQLEREYRSRTTNNPYSDYGIKLPRPMLNTDDLDFSFSGLKTSVLYLIKNIKTNHENLDRFVVSPREDEKQGFSLTNSTSQNSPLQNTRQFRNQNTEIELPIEIKQKIALEFEEAVNEVLVKKTLKAVEKFKAKTLILGGGVSANNYLRQNFQELENENLKVFVPPASSSTDNAVMIGVASYFNYLKQKKEGQSLSSVIDLRADGNLNLD